MRLLVVPWLVAAAGCATTGQGSAVRHEEVRLAPGEEGPPPAPPKADAPEAPPGEAPPGASVEKPQAAAEVAMAKPGPRSGRFGIRTILLGTSLTPGASLVPSFGFRLFVQDTLSLNSRVGLGLISEEGVVRTGYQFGLGASLYTRSDGLPGVYPFFEGEALIGRTETRERNSTVLSLTVGFGLEAWVSPYVSTGALLRVGIAGDFSSETFAVGTINPGVIITIYLN